MTSELAVITTISIGVLNLLALGFVAWQVCLTRKSVLIAQKSLTEAQQTKEIQNLPQVSYLLNVKVRLEGWMADLQLIIDHKEEIRALIKANEGIEMKTSHWFGEAKGLVDKWLYDHLPKWLQIMLVSAAQYYFEGMCLAKYICSTDETQSYRLSMFNEMLDRAKTGFGAITSMLAYINDTLPKWYLESTESLQYEEFMK